MQWRPSTTEMLVATVAIASVGLRGQQPCLRLHCHAVPLEPCAVGLNCFTLVTVCFNRDFSKPLMPPNNACLLLSILRHCRKRSSPAQRKWQNNNDKLSTGMVMCEQQMPCSSSCNADALPPFQSSICMVLSCNNAMHELENQNAHSFPLMLLNMLNIQRTQLGIAYCGMLKFFTLAQFNFSACTQRLVVAMTRNHFQNKFTDTKRRKE